MSLETPTFPSVIDSTMRSSFIECPTKFYQAFILNLAPKGRSIHLEAGGAFAKGCEVARRSFYDEGVPPEASIDRGCAAALLAYDPEVDDPNSQKSRDRVVEAIESYFTEYPLGRDPVVPFKNAGKSAIEFSFAIPLPITHPDTNEPLLFAGRFDMLALFQNTLWVVDEKTATQLGPTWARKFDLRAQMSAYCWAARQYDYAVAGAIIRGVGFLKTQITHTQVMVHRPEWLVERWYRQLLRDVDRMIQCYKQNYWDLAYDDACAAYGGCGFLNVCNKEDPRKWYPMYYEERNWNPLHKGD